MSINAVLVRARDGVKPGTRIVTIEGPMTMAHLDQLHADLRKETQPFTILDLSAVPYMDSSGLGILLAYYVSCRNSERKLVVAGVGEHILRLLELTTTRNLLTIASTVEKAEDLC